MADYKSTLNLPATTFLMKANLASREKFFLKKWQDDDLYHQIRMQNQGKPKFILHDGPPYANGDIHIGHAVNKVLKDIIIKSKSLSGFDAPYLPGWDCHGLPIELNVEKKKGKVGQKIDAKEFRAECRKYADSQIFKQRQDFKRLGILGDWDKPYLTKDFKYEADIVRALAEIVKNGHVSKGHKPVHWCCDCASALAEAEVEYKDKQSPAVYVKFELTEATKSEFIKDILKDKGDLASLFDRKKPIFIVVWTTTPWTLPANEAVALNSKLKYFLVSTDTEHHIYAKDCYDKIASNLNYDGVLVPDINILERKLVKHPFYDKQVPIIFGDHVSGDTGTGCVHIAPSHGEEDFALGLKYQLPVKNLVNNYGVFFDDVPLVGGQFVFKANPIVIEALKQKNTLLLHQDVSHSYPYCWRHKTPVIFRATPQWFISMQQNGLRDAVNSEIPKVEWIPDWGKKRIELMVANRPDWCISRQRFWGVPVTLFVHKQTGELHPNTQKLFTVIASKIEKSGIEAWFESDIADFLGDDAKDYNKTTDTLDVWFDSGVSHYAVLKNRAELSTVADLYLEGSDQHRGWFQSSIISAVAINGKAPYKQVLTHGFTVDKDGKKMSKSLGNVVSPQKVVNHLGADILRLWIASTDYTGEMSVSDEILRHSADSYRRIRNTLRFMLANMNGFEVDKHLVGFKQMLVLDQWIVNVGANLQEEIKIAYKDYNFHRVVSLIMNFCSNYLGSFYLDIIKDRQYTMQKNSLGRRSAQSALYYITQAMVRWIAPILSFTAEEVWQHLPGASDESIFLQNWYGEIGLFTGRMKHQSGIEATYYLINDVRQQIEKLRNDKIIGSSLESEVDIYCDDAIFTALHKLGNDLRFVFITSYARVQPLDNKDSDCISTSKDGVFIKVEKSKHKKCVRCWHHREDVGDDSNHPKLCARCVENVAGDGEQRLYA